MWYLSPEEGLLMVQTRQEEMRADAMEANLAGLYQRPRPPLGRVSGLQLRLGRLLIVIGRTLREDEPPCPDLMRS